MSMRNSSDSFPEPPELPSFRVEEDAPLPVEERHTGTGLVRHDVALDEDRIDPDAAKVVRRLERSGFQAYLVGGCVRDLLLGGKPKDYDVATSARPEDVRGLFRNCRIIGRRFRLAHVMFGGRSYGRGSGGGGGVNGGVKIVEVATFRRMPHELTALGASASDASGDEDLIIRNDNVFGEAHEDALRRDFTINALFYDLDRRQVLDWCGGMEDIKQRVIRTIGEPSVRFREDPIRILRAIKFASRLDLGLDPTLYESAVFHREELAKAAKARVFEEILRLLRGGASSRSIYLLWEIGAMAVLLPELSAYLDDDEGTGGGSARIYRRLRAVDKLTKSRGAIDDIALWTTLLYEPMKELASGGESADDVDAFLEDLIRRLNMPRRVADGVGRITKQLPRLRKGQFGRFMLTDLGAAALDVLEVDLMSKGRDAASIAHLRRQRAEAIANAPRQRRPSR
ncbi:MAG: polynucleotide adenylyltransferase PcnB [Polyangiaceae bacterium]